MLAFRGSAAGPPRRGVGGTATAEDFAQHDGRPQPVISDRAALVPDLQRALGNLVSDAREGLQELLGKRDTVDEETCALCTKRRIMAEVRQLRGELGLEAGDAAPHREEPRCCRCRCGLASAIEAGHARCEELRAVSALLQRYTLPPRACGIRHCSLNQPEKPLQASVAEEQTATHTAQATQQTTGDHDEEGELCAICQEPCRPGGAGGGGSALRCGHAFHPQCIAQWTLSGAAQHSKCPTCRQDIVDQPTDHAAPPAGVHGDAGLPGFDPEYAYPLGDVAHVLFRLGGPLGDFMIPLAPGAWRPQTPEEEPPL
jgi:hypothetical protein